ncbi:hypothetical protein Pst134EB_012717 [Puccinia striiformis f. sp. tritici]|nr:hypothetical protein Pst134EB_012717 [Puccinia striiformis f. sp. tritici]
MGATEEDEQKGSLGGSIARECGEVDEVLDSLVRTILSQHTSQANSIRAKQALDKHFGTGLAVKKSNAIHELLNHIYLNLNPNLSLEFIRYLPDSEAMDVLTSFKGVGAKTASCVMLFCLGRNFFPVDTHVFRITKALAWIPPTSTRESAFKHLNQTVPDDLKYPLHILLFKHAQHCSICKRINTSQNHNQSTLPSPSHKIGVLSRKNLSHKKASKAKALCPLQALFLWN